MKRHLRLLSMVATTAVGAGCAMVPLTAGAAAAPPQKSVTIGFTKPATTKLYAGDNEIEARGKTTLSIAMGRIFVNLPYADTDEQGPVESLLGQVAFTGAGPDPVWNRLRVNFVDDVVTGFTGSGQRLRLLRMVSLDTDRYGFEEDTALLLTQAGANSLNKAAKGTPFQAGDLVATADGLS